jgi:hypothetical protein
MRRQRSGPQGEPEELLALGWRHTMRWIHVSLGILLFLAAGLLIACAVYDGGTTLWAMAGLSLVLGGLTAAIALPRRGRPAAEPESTICWDSAAAPPLGQMLVNYGLISEADLNAALSVQQQTGRRLGQTLVAMKLVTHEQVAEVLEEQLSRREGRLRWGASAGLVE